MFALYKKLLQKHGPQGWWPINNNYHPGDFTYPRNRQEQFEIALGAILTQNTNWNNVQLALNNLRARDLLLPEKLLIAEEEIVKNAIRSAGYFNQKYKKIKIFSNFFLQHSNPTREQLLALWGIGPETADSILLYAFRTLTFVVDTYTKRVLLHEQLLDNPKIDYHQLQNIIVQAIPADLEIYQEFHALLVAAAKQLS